MAQFKSAKTLLDHLVATGGRIEVAAANTVMTPLGLAPYKLPTYIWHIREKFQIPVTVEKQGRQVTAYVLDLKADPANAEQPTDDSGDNAVSDSDAQPVVEATA